MNLFLCMDCNAISELTKHGRCGVCGSDAVIRRTMQHLALIARLYPEIDPCVAELEKLFEKV